MTLFSAQKKVAEENNFSFIGETAINEAGHVANMTNQLRAVLYDIRMETMGYAKNSNINGRVRRCPHCAEVWNLGKMCWFWQNSSRYILYEVKRRSYARAEVENFPLAGHKLGRALAK